MKSAGARRLEVPLITILMAASGFAGLGYQIVWTEQCSLLLGHEAPAVLAVVTAFFGGLAVGGLALGPRIESARKPLRWYVACEAIIGLWGLCLSASWLPFRSIVLAATGISPSAGRQWAVAFLATFLVLLPSTSAMGATLPAMERVVSRERTDNRSIAALYAANTFGAVLGVLASTFWLIPAAGLTRTTQICAALNCLCAVAAWRVFPPVSEPERSMDRWDRSRARWVLIRLAWTGFLGIGYEVIVVRVLSQVTEDTVYTFALLLAVYLIGTAGGAAAYERWFAKQADDQYVSDRLLAALSTACLFGAGSLFFADRTRAAAVNALDGGMGAAVLAEAVLAACGFLLPTFVMGALFSHLSRAASSAHVSFGRAVGINVAAATAAPAVFGVVIVPAFGAKVALVIATAGYLAAVSRRSFSSLTQWAPLAGILVLALVAPPLTFVQVPQGGRLVSYEEGVMAAVSVVADEAGTLRLRINNRQQEGSSATRRVDARQAWLPLLLHPHPQTALFLGLGTGVTASSAAEDPSLDVDAVELLPEVIRASSYFTAPASRLHVLSADARRYVRASTRSYDVIVSDNFHPARSGSGSLYTVEHFEAVRERLAPRGVFCQWLPLHQLDLSTLRSIVRSFLAAYPESWAALANNSLETPVLGLVARRDADRFDIAEVEGRIARLALPEQMQSLGFEDELAVLGSIVAGPPALARFAASVLANTDDRPLVAYRAPRTTYAPDSNPADRLSALLHELSVEPEQVVRSDTDPTLTRRLAAYWAARNRFIESGRDVRPTARVKEMLNQVREPLLAVLRQSPDFRPAYDPLLSMATALAKSDPVGARALLAELAQIQPARSEAARLLSSLDRPMLGGATAR